MGASVGHCGYGADMHNHHLARSGFHEVFGAGSVKRRENQDPAKSNCFSEFFGDGCTDLRDSATYLVEIEAGELALSIGKRLEAELESQCHCDDVFLDLLKQRLCLLTRIYDAVKSVRASKNSLLLTAVISPQHSRFTDGLSAGLVEFGVRVLYCIVNFIGENDNEARLRKLLLVYLPLLLGDLKPMCLLNEVEIHLPISFNINSGTVLLTARKILLRFTIEASKFNHHKLASVALTRLASARGHASDLLAVINHFYEDLQKKTRMLDQSSASRKYDKRAYGNTSDHKIRQLLRSSQRGKICHQRSSKSPLATVTWMPAWALLRQLQLTDEDQFGACSNGAQKVTVWSCGQNACGELLHGDRVTRGTFTKAPHFKEIALSDVSAGSEHTVVLAKSGQIYCGGNNDNGQCSEGACGEIRNITKSLGGSVSKIGTHNGCEHTLVVLKDGQLISFGRNHRGQLGHGFYEYKSVPRVVHGLEARYVSKLSCGYYHSAVAVLETELYTFGRNDFGQLGHGDLIDKLRPRSVDRLSGCSVRSVSCGEYHTCVADSSGTISSCGKNDYGQLGCECMVEYEANMKKILLEDWPRDWEVVQICCGYYHTVGITSNWSVLSFGRNDHGQLGLGYASLRVHGPRRLGTLNDASIVLCATGAYHTVFVQKDGLLHVCGLNDHGQLGTGDRVEHHFPFTLKCFQNSHISKATAGFHHTLVLIDDNVNVTDALRNRQAKRQHSVAETKGDSSEFEIHPSTTIVDAAAALFICSHMDRLLGIKDERVMAISGCAFELIFFLLDSLVREVLQTDKQNGVTKEIEAPEKACLIIFVLSILRHSIVRLIEHGASGKVRRTQYRWSHAPKHIFVKDLLAADRVQQELNAGTFRLHDQGRTCNLLNSFEVLLFQLTSQSFRTDNLTETIQRDNMTETIQREAASILLCGFNLFYPSRSLQIKCITDVLKQSGGNQQQGKTAGTHFFVEAVMKKVATESFAASLVPVYNVVVFSGGKTEVTTLIELIELLAEKIPSQFTLLARDALLALQKQIMVLGTTAEQVRTSETRLSLVIDTTSSASSTLSSHSLIESASLQCNIGHDKLTPCMECLSDFALHLIRLNMDYIGNTSSPCQPHHSRHEDLSHVLLSLVTGAVHFSCYLGMANRLLWPVANLLIEMDKRSCFGSALLSTEEAGSEITPRLSSRSSDLLKTFTVLSGRLANTLLGQAPKNVTNSIWLGSDLMRFGVKSSCISAFLSNGLMSGGRSHDSPHNYSNIGFLPAHFSKLDCAQRQKLKALFYSWLRSALCTVDRTYQFVVNQVKASHDKEKIWVIEKLVAECLFKYNNLAAQTIYYSYVNFGKVNSHAYSVHAPERFRAVWSLVARLTTWAWQTRNKVHSGSQTDAFFHDVVIAVKSLFMFRSDASSSLSLTYVPSSCGIILADGAEPKLSHATSARAWRLAQIKVRAAVRWRRTCVIKTTALPALMRSRKYPLACKSLLFNYIIDLCACKSKTTTSLLSGLLTNVATNYHVSTMRAKGIETYHYLFSSLTSKCLIIILASSLNNTLRASFKCGTSLFVCEDAVDNILRSEIQHSSEKLFGGFLRHIKICTSYFSGSVAINKALVSVADVRILLVVFNAWGKCALESWRFLVKEDILLTVHKVFAALYSALASDMNMDIDRSLKKARVSFNALCNKAVLKRCLRASWVLIRQFGVAISLATGADSCAFCALLKQFNAVMHDIARRVLVQLRLTAVHAATHSRSTNMDSAQGRRCQELISAPVRFTTMETGILLSLSDGLSHSTGPDFSITCWFFSTQDFTGHYRSFLVRGLDKDAWPVVLLRDLDSKIEIGCLHSSSRMFCKILTAKDSVPLNTWTHIGLVFEGSKIRLYLDGSLDSQQINSSFDPKPMKLRPLFVGGLPEDSRFVNGIHGGIEGSIANLKYYSRALSPIHVRVLYDEGAPEATRVCHDRVCNQACSSIYAAVSFPPLRSDFVRWTWLNLFFNFFLFGSTRVQQAVVKIWRLLLPACRPIYLANCSPRHDWFGELRTHVTIKEILCASRDDGAFIDYMLAIIGLCMLREKHNVREIRKFMGMIIPQNLIQVYDQGVDFNQSCASIKSVIDASSLACGMTLLLQTLSGAEKWTRSALKSVTESVTRTQSCIEVFSRGKTPMLWAQCLASLCILGGHSSEIYRGAKVVIFGVGVEAIVVDCDESLSSARVVLSRKGREFASLSESEDLGIGNKVDTLTRLKHVIPSILDTQHIIHLSSAKYSTLHNMCMESMALYSLQADAYLAKVLVPCLLGLLRSGVSSSNKFSSICDAGYIPTYTCMSLCSRTTKALWMLTSGPRLRNLISCSTPLCHTMFDTCSTVRSELSSLPDESKESGAIAVRRRIFQIGRPLVKQDQTSTRWFYHVAGATHACNAMCHVDLCSARSLVAGTSSSNCKPLMLTRLNRFAFLGSPFGRKDQGFAALDSQKFGGVRSNERLPTRLDEAVGLLSLDWADLVAKSHRVECRIMRLYAHNALFRLLDAHATASAASPNIYTTPEVCLELVPLLSERCLRSRNTKKFLGGILQRSFRIIRSELAAPGPNVKLMNLITGRFIVTMETAALLGASTLSSWVSHRSESNEIESGHWLITLPMHVGVDSSGGMFMRLCNCIRSLNVSLKVAILKIITGILMVWRDAWQPINHSLHQTVPSRLFWLGLFHECNFVPHLRLKLKRRILLESHQKRPSYSNLIRAMTECLLRLAEMENAFVARIELEYIQDFDLSIGPPKLLRAMPHALHLGWKPEKGRPVLMYELRLSERAFGSLDVDSFHVVYRGSRTDAIIGCLVPSRTYHVQLYVLFQSGRPRPVGGVVCYETSMSSPWGFDRSKSGPDIHTCASGMTAVYDGNESWSTILGSSPMLLGKNHWHIIIEASSTSHIFIGVALQSTDLRSFLGSDNLSWGCIGDRALYHKRTKMQVYGEKFGQGDSIKVSLDSYAGTISLSKNGTDYGVAFRGLYGQLYPAVAFYNKGQRVRLLLSSSACQGAGLMIPNSPSTFGIETLDYFVRLTRSLSTRRTPCAGTRYRSFKLCQSWEAGHLKQYMTVYGYALRLDSSSLACKRFGFCCGQHLNTPRGNSVVVGVGSGLLWCQDEGLTVILPCQETPKTENESDMHDNSNDDDFLNCEIKLAAQHTDTVISDELLVAAMNDASTATRTSPWNISPFEFLKALTSKLRHKLAGGQLKRRASLLLLFNEEVSCAFRFVAHKNTQKLNLRSDISSRGVRSCAEVHGLATAMHMARPYVFSSTKETTFNQHLKYTMYQAKRTEDDYDYPEDLPTVLINRRKAATASSISSPEVNRS